MTNKERLGTQFEILKHIEKNNIVLADLTVIFVVKGIIEVETENNRYILNQEDIIVINQGVNHNIHEKSSSIVAYIKYSPKILSALIKKENILFFCNSTTDKNRSYRDLQDIFHSLIYQYTYETHQSYSYTASQLMALLDCLVEKYMIKNQNGMIEDSSLQKELEEDERVKKIILYVNNNYQYEVSLNDLTEKLYASASTLSRLFKKHTGIYFADYVKQVRVKYALEELLDSNYTLTKIAVDCGFSNPSVFNRSFKEVYGENPSVLRQNLKENYAEETNAKEKLEQDLKEEIKQSSVFAMPQKNLLNVSINGYDEGSRYSKNWNKMINIGSFFNLISANVQNHAMYLHNNLGFEYMRIWNLFSKKMLLTDGHTAIYNYDKIDQVLDFFVINKIKPFIDMGLRPNAILNSNNSIFYEEEHIRFDSKQLWQNAVTDFFHHVVKRYGRDLVSQWIIEISYDVRHEKKHFYYDDENYSFIQIYSYIYETAKSIIPEIKVGALSAIINDDRKFVEKALQQVKEKNCIFDFISFIFFPYFEKKDENGKSIRNIVETESDELDKLDLIKDILKKNNIDDMKIYITEINNSISNRNFLNDSCYRSAFLVNKLQQLWDNVECTSILMGSDWVSSYIDSIGVATGSIGILTKSTIPKPAYYAVSFMNQLADNLVKKDKNYIITRTNAGEYYILCFNYKHFNKNYYLQDEDVPLTKDTHTIFENNDNLEIHFTFMNMKNGKYIIKRRIVNENSGNILNEWSKLEYSVDLSKSDLDYLSKVCIPQMTIEKKSILTTVLDMSFKLEPHEISLVHIYREIG